MASATDLYEFLHAASGESDGVQSTMVKLFGGGVRSLFEDHERRSFIADRIRDGTILPAAASGKELQSNQFRSS